MDLPPFIHSVVDRWLNCFHILALMNNTAIHIIVCVWCTYPCIVSEYTGVSWQGGCILYSWKACTFYGCHKQFSTDVYSSFVNHDFQIFYIYCPFCFLHQLLKDFFFTVQLMDFFLSSVVLFSLYIFRLCD